MKNKMVTMLLVSSLAIASLVGCGSNTETNVQESATNTEVAQEETSVEETKEEVETLEYVVSGGPETGATWNYIYEEEPYRDVEMVAYTFGDTAAYYQEFCGIPSDIPSYVGKVPESWRFSRCITPTGETYAWKRYEDSVPSSAVARMGLGEDGSYWYEGYNTQFSIRQYPIEEKPYKDYDEESLQRLFPLQGYQEVAGSTYGQYFVDEGENYFRFTRGVSWTGKTASNTDEIFDGLQTGYICFFDDYETQVRYLFFVVNAPGRPADEENMLEMINSVEPIKPISNQGLMSNDGLDGRVENTFFIYAEDEQTAVVKTTFTNTGGTTMDFCWEGPLELVDVIEENGSLYLKDENEKYKLRACSMTEGPSEYGTSNDFSIAGAKEKIVGEWLGYLDDTESYAEGTSFDVNATYRSAEVVFPIIGEGGYKGYAYYIFEGEGYSGEEEYYYVFTYMEHESVYDDERALRVINSIQHHNDYVLY